MFEHINRHNVALTPTAKGWYFSLDIESLQVNCSGWVSAAWAEKSHIAVSLRFHRPSLKRYTFTMMACITKKCTNRILYNFNYHWIDFLPSSGHINQNQGQSAHVHRNTGFLMLICLPLLFCFMKASSIRGLTNTVQYVVFSSTQTHTFHCHLEP